MAVVFGGATALRILYQNRNLANEPRVCIPLDSRSTTGCSSSRAPGSVALTAPSFCSSKSQQAHYQASLLGLDHRHLSVIATSGSVRAHTDATVVYSVSPVPQKKLACIDCGEFLVASPELCYLQEAAKLQLVDVILLGYQLCGDYSMFQKTESGAINRTFRPLTTPTKLALFLEGLPAHTAGLHRAKEALKYVLPRSYSQRESRVTLYCILPHRLGGYGLPWPLLNQDIPGTSRVGDICWLDKRFIIEYDSDLGHSSSQRQDADSARAKEIELVGSCRVMCIRTAEANDYQLMDTAIRCAAKNLGVRLRSADQIEKRSAGYGEASKKLHYLLFERKGAFDQVVCEPRGDAAEGSDPS